MNMSNKTQLHSEKYNYTQINGHRKHFFSALKIYFKCIMIYIKMMWISHERYAAIY
jgi:hypothetical protein